MLEMMLNGGKVAKSLVPGEYTLTQTITGSTGFGGTVAVNSNGNLLIGGLDSLEVSFYEKDENGFNKTGGFATPATVGKESCISDDGSWMVVTDESVRIAIVYKNVNGVYTEYQTIINDVSTFGRACAMTNDGSILVIGAALANSCFVYKLTTEGYVLSQTIAGGIWSGGSLDISPDGNTLLVGAYSTGEAVFHVLNSTGRYEPLQTIKEPGLFGVGCAVSRGGEFATINDLNDGPFGLYKLGSENKYTKLAIALPTHPIGWRIYAFKAAINDDGTIFANSTPSLGYVNIYSNLGGKVELINVFSGAAGFGVDFAMSGDGKHLVIGNGKGIVNCYEYL